jgi:hypothetical protein
MNEQLLKDLVATAQKYKYDWNTVLPKFPEFKGYDAQLLKDYVATAEKYKYDYATVNSKFPEFKLKKKEPTASISPSGQKPTSSVTPVKKEQKPSVSSYEVKSESKLPDGSTQKIIRGDAGKGNKTYALRKLPNGREAWYEYSHSEDSMGLQEVDANGKKIGKPTPVKYNKPTSGAKDYFDKPITDPNRVSTLNRKFGYKASVKADEDIYTGFPEKENNEYRVAKLQNGQEVWEVRRKGQQDFTTISNKGSINALNNQFGKKVSASSDAELKRDAQIARQKSSSTDFKEVNKDLIGKEEDEVIKKLTSLYGNKGFTFRPYGLLTDWVIVEAKNGKTMKVSLDNTWSSSDSTEAINLRIFLSENQVLNDYIDKEREQAVGAEKKLVDLTQFDFNRQMSRLQGAGSQSEFENAKEINATETATKTLMDKSQEAKDLRKAIIRSEFDTQQRISDLSGLTSNKLGKAELAAIAEANKNSYVERYMINDSYINDIAESRKDIELKAAKLRSDVDEFNAYAASNNLDPESPEAIEKKSALEAKYNDLIEKSNNIDSEIEGISLIKSQNEKNAALYFAYNETRGTVGGGLWNGALKGFFGLLGNENAEAMVDIFGSEFTTDEFIQSEDRSDLTKAAFSVSESLGALAAALVTGGTSAEGTLARKVGQQLPFFAMSYNEIKGEMDSKEFSDVPAWQKEGLAIMYGLGIGYLDKISSNFMIKGKIPNSIAKGLILRSIAGLEKGATAEAISAAIESNLKKDLAAGVLKVVAKQLVEGATEGTQSLAGSGLKAAFNSMTGQYEDENGEKVDRFNLNDWGKQALEEAYLGALGGAIMGVPTSLIKGAKNGFKRLSPVQMELNKKVIEDSNMRSMILTDIKTKLISGDITKEEAKEQLDAIKEASGLFAKMPDNLSPESTAKSFDLIVERSKIEKEISGKEDNLVVAQKERIKEINNELQTISKDAVQEQAAGEVSVQPETTTSEEVVQGKPKSGPEVVTEEGKKEELDAVNNRILKIEYANSKGELLEDSEPGELKRLKARKKELESASETDQVTTKSGPEVVTEEGKKEEIDAKQAEFDAIQIETIKKGEELQAQGLTNEEIESNPEFLSIRDRMDAAWTELDALKQPKETDTTETVQETPVTSGVVQEATQDQVTTLRAQEQVELAEAIPNIDEYKVDGEVDKNSMPADVLAKYNEIYDKYDKLITPLLTTAQASTSKNQVTLDNFQELENQAVQEGNDTKIKTLRAARMVIKSLPGVKVFIHNSPEEYQQALADASGDSIDTIRSEEASERSGGQYVNGEIHVDGSIANERTVYHEAFHDAILKAGLSVEMAKGLLKIISDKKIKSQLEAFISQYESSEQNEEMVSELGAIMAEAGTELSTTKLQQFKQLINKLAQKLGLPVMFPASADRQQVVDFINTMSKAIRTGRAVDMKTKIDTANVSTKKRKIGAFDVQYFEDSEQFQKLVDQGLVENNFDLGTISGEVVAIHQPDNMFVGTIKHKGEEIFTGNGGVFYTPNTGNVWASGAETSAKSLSNLINKSLEESTDGVGRLVLVRGTDSKMISSTEGVKAAMSIVELLVDKGLISRAEFRSSLIRAGKKFNIDFSGKDSSTAIHKDIKDKFMDVKNSTFQRRGDFFDEVINDLASTSKTAKENIEDIRSELGSKRKISFSKDGIRDSIGELLTERLLSGLPTSHAYAVIEVTSPVTYKERKGHDSYPWILVSDSKPVLKLLSNREHAVKGGIFEMIDGSDVSQAKLGLAQRGMGIAKIAESKEPKSTGRKKRMTEPVAGNKLFNEPLKDASKIANDYAKKSGIDFTEPERVTKLDEENSKAIAAEYDKMKNNPTDPEVKKAYDAMISETISQYEEIIGNGYVVEVNNNEPYSSSGDMISDLKDNKRMKIFSTESGFGDDPITDQQREDNPLLQKTKFKDVNGVPLLANDLFRFVHDFFGHAKFGNGFGPVGEENAWVIHSAMYSDPARRAMTSETRGQNSWVNFSGANDAVFKLRDKARVLRQEGKIDEANELIGQVYDQMQFADQKVGLMPEWVSETGAYSRKKQKTTPSNQAVNKAKEKYDLSIKRGNSVDQARESAINDLKKSDWYNNANDISREDAVRDLRSKLGIKEKKSPSVDKITGKPKDKKVIVNDRTALKNQLRLEAKAARESQMDLKQKQRALIVAINKMKRGGLITVNQASILAKRLAFVNVDNPIMVERFLGYAEKLFGDAEYSAKLNSAFELQKKIKKAIKSDKLQASVVATAKAFSKLNPSLVEDIDAYIENANTVFQSVVPSRTSGLSVDLKTAMDINAVGEYVDAATEFENEYKKKELMQVYKDLVESGVITNDMSLSEIKELVASITNEKEEGLTAEDKKAYIMSWLGSTANIYRPIIKSMLNGRDPFTGDDVVLSEKQDKIMRDFLKIDVTKMDVREAMFVVEAMDNFITNKITDGLETVIEKYNGNLESKKLADSGFKTRSMNTFGNEKSKLGTGRLWAQEMMSLKTLTDLVFRGINNAQKITKAMGLSAYENGVALANRLWNNSIDSYYNEFKKKKPNGEKFMSAKNIYERGMYAALKRTVPGNQQVQDAEFKRKIKLINDSISTLMKGSERDQEIGKMYSEVAEKLGINEAGVTMLDIESRVDSNNMKAVDWWVSKWADNYSELADVSQNVYNTILDRDMYYTPDKFSSTKPVEKSVEEVFESGGAFGQFLDYEYDKKSGVLMPSAKQSSMAEGRFLDLNFDMNNSKSLKAALVDMKTATSIRKISGFLKSKDWEKVMTAKEDRDVFRKKIDNYILRSRNKSTGAIDNDYAQALDKAGKIWASMGAARALGGLTQPLKQTIPILFSTIVNSGRVDFAIGKDQNDWISKIGRGISNRGLESQSGFEDANRMIDDAVNSGNAVKVLSAIERTNRSILRTVLAKPDVFIARSSFISYYKQYMANNGMSEDINYSKPEDANQDALDYAQRMIDRQQNVSDGDLAGELMASNNPYKKLTRNILLPFASFAINQKSRMFTDFATLMGKEVSSQDRVLAARSLGGLAVEIAVFNAIAFGIKAGIIAIAGEIVPPAPEDEKEKEKELWKQWEYIIGNVIASVISPVPLTDSSVISSSDWVYKQVNKIAKSSSGETKEALKKHNEERELNDQRPLVGREADRWMENYQEEDRFKIRGYTNENMAGTYTITYNKLVELKKSYDLAFNGKYEQDMYGKVQKKYILKEDREVLKNMWYGNAITNILGFPSEYSSVNRRVENNVKKKSAISEKKFDTYNDVVSHKGGELNKAELFLVKNMDGTKSQSGTDRVIEEIEWIKENGGFDNERQMDKYIEIYQKEKSVNSSDMYEIKKIK